MLELDKKMRDEIVMVLRDIIAPATSGYTIMQIVQLLTKLKEVEIPKKDVPPTNL